MSATAAPEPISSINTGISDHRRHGGQDPFKPARTAAQPTDVDLDIEPASAPPPELPPLPELAAPGTAFVMAVLSGALAPRPPSLREVFLRTGTGWVPPESGYRLADKKI